MSRPNQRYLQLGLFDAIRQLPEKTRERTRGLLGQHLAYFDQAACEACLLAAHCPTQRLKRRPVRVLRLTTCQVQVTQLRQRSAQARRPGRNLQAALESTVRSLKHPFGGQTGKLPAGG